MDKIGDMVLSTPVFRAVREAFPGAKTALLLKAYTKDLVKENTDIDELMIIDELSIKELFSALKKLNPDLVFVLNYSIWGNILAFISGARHRVGFETPGGTFLLTKKSPNDLTLVHTHKIETYLHMVKSIGITPGNREPAVSITKEGEEEADRFLKNNMIDTERLLVLIHPGSGGIHTRWKKEGFAEVADRIIAEYNGQVIILGSVGEKDLVSEVINIMTSKEAVQAVGLPLSMVISIIKKCDLFVGNSTGTMHVAAALKVPVVAIFGNKHPIDSYKKWGPWGEGHLIVTNDPGCKNCHPADCRTYECLNSITADEVFSGVEKQIKNSRKKSNILVEGEKMINKEYCMSSFLTFRFVADPEAAWTENVKSEVPSTCSDNEETAVRTKEEVITNLRKVIETETKGKKVGVLLSGGIDSAIVASFLPKGTPAYTIRFIADWKLDEPSSAAKYVDYLKLDHRIIDVRWEDYIEHSEELMRRCGSPLHPVEVPLYKASMQAKKDSIDLLVCGCGADSRFGGLDKLLSKDWKFEEFIPRYTFVNPELVLKKPVSMRKEYARFRDGDNFDLRRFILETQNCGAFFNAVEAAGVTLLNPFEHIYMEGEWDLQRIRNGESKYLLREAFRELFNGMEVPEKIAFARPMDIWLKDWEGPCRPEFLEDIDMSQFSGDQKYLIFSLEYFLKRVLYKK
ncbi:MAG: hypothetical protein JXJ19_00075 [Elusimicrobia bacterium]|nr:hypothetical protein [Elusimicrobiota bacterium]